jgi:cardiolipin synthase A/B
VKLAFVCDAAHAYLMHRDSLLRALLLPALWLSLACCSDGTKAPAAQGFGEDAGVLDAGSGESDAAFQNDAGPKPDPTWISQLGLQGPVTHFSNPNPNGFEVPLAEFASAKTSIDMVIFNITETKSIAALKAAKARGVAVRMIVDDAVSQADFDDLKNSGISICRGSSGFSITHEKSFIVDKKRTTIMTANMTKLYAATRDFGIVTSDPGVAAEWQQVFDADWVNAAGATMVTPALSNPNLLWAPVSSGPKLVALVQSATRTIDFAVENISDTEFLNALRAAAVRGVAIRSITPRCPLGQPALNNFGALQPLMNAGATIKLAAYPSNTAKPYIHQKMLIVDDARMYIGSVNFSVNSIRKARELGIVLVDAPVIAAMKVNFDADFAVATLLPPTSPTNCP